MNFGVALNLFIEHFFNYLLIVLVIVFLYLSFKHLQHTKESVNSLKKIDVQLEKTNILVSRTLGHKVVERLNEVKKEWENQKEELSQKDGSILMDGKKQSLTQTGSSREREHRRKKNE